MNKFVFIFGLLLSLSSLANTRADENIDSFIGEWTGTGKQINGSQWTIRINIFPQFYVIDYPSLTCGGVLSLPKITESSVAFKETLTYGATRCLEHGNVVIHKLTNDEATYHWSNSQNKIEAEGTLIRTKTPITRK